MVKQYEKKFKEQDITHFKVMKLLIKYIIRAFLLSLVSVLIYRFMFSYVIISFGHIKIIPLWYQYPNCIMNPIYYNSLKKNIDDFLDSEYFKRFNQKYNKQIEDEYLYNLKTNLMEEEGYKIVSVKDCSGECNEMIERLKERWNIHINADNKNITQILVSKADEGYDGTYDKYFIFFFDIESKRVVGYYYLEIKPQYYTKKKKVATVFLKYHFYFY